MIKRERRTRFLEIQYILKTTATKRVNNNTQDEARGRRTCEIPRPQEKECCSAALNAVKKAPRFKDVGNKDYFSESHFTVSKPAGQVLHVGGNIHQFTGNSISIRAVPFRYNTAISSCPLIGEVSFLGKVVDEKNKTHSVGRNRHPLHLKPFIDMYDNVAKSWSVKLLLPDHVNVL
mmetsp:Transcript_25604/g.75563  ORF Transcript_25604/g.75563 Transcript_25604/m.75563 type:complete len:176 (-) Transcript_25604:44-571(-)